jgi:hypothetical protein
VNIGFDYFFQEKGPKLNNILKKLKQKTNKNK